MLIVRGEKTVRNSFVYLKPMLMVAMLSVGVSSLIAQHPAEWRVDYVLSGYTRIDDQPTERIESTESTIKVLGDKRAFVSSAATVTISGNAKSVPSNTYFVKISPRGKAFMSHPRMGEVVAVDSLNTKPFRADRTTRLSEPTIIPLRLNSDGQMVLELSGVSRTEVRSHSGSFAEATVGFDVSVIDSAAVIWSQRLYDRLPNGDFLSDRVTLVSSEKSRIQSGIRSVGFVPTVTSSSKGWNAEMKATLSLTFEGMGVWKGQALNVFDANRKFINEGVSHTEWSKSLTIKSASRRQAESELYNLAAKLFFDPPKFYQISAEAGQPGNAAIFDISLKAYPPLHLTTERWKKTFHGSLYQDKDVVDLLGKDIVKPIFVGYLNEGKIFQPGVKTTITRPAKRDPRLSIQGGIFAQSGSHLSEFNKGLLPNLSKDELNFPWVYDREHTGGWFSPFEPVVMEFWAVPLATVEFPVAAQYGQNGYISDINLIKVKNPGYVQLYAPKGGPYGWEDTLGTVER